MKSVMICAIGAISLLLATQARAGCLHLTGAVSIALEGFKNGAQPDAETLARMGDQITDLNNEAMLRALRATGQAGDFSDLRNFLTQLKFISGNVSPGFVEITPQFMRNLGQAERIVRAACLLPDGSVRVDAEDTAAAHLSSLDKTRTGIGKNWRSALQIKKDKEAAALHQSHDIGILGMVLFGFFSLGLATFAAHYAIIAIRIIHRGRKLCHVPALLEIMGGEIEGRLTMIGIYGCSFEQSKNGHERDISQISEKTYCQIVVGGTTINASVIRNGKDVCDFWFVKPLPRPTLKHLLALSDEPAVYDFTVLRTAHQRGLIFGVGALPFR